MATFSDIAPVFAVRDLTAALAHYRKLGFAVEAHNDGDEYGFARRDNVLIHLAVVADLDPLTNSACAYVYVSDADKVGAEWEDAAVAGRLVLPVDTDYGLRQGAHVDADGNLIRFGSPLGKAWPRPRP